MGLLEDYVWWLTPLINGTLGLLFLQVRIWTLTHWIALLAGCLSFQLPETNNQAMTTTIEEFEQKYGKHEKIIDSKSGIENDGYQEDKL